MDRVFAVDPGTFESAFVELEGSKILRFGKIPNEELARLILSRPEQEGHFAIEMVASYGMAVGKTTFETVFWIGRFWETACHSFLFLERLYRKTDVGKFICPKQRVKDSTIRAGVIRLLGPPGTSKNPGPTYGVTGDVWSALAVGLTYQDKFLKPKQDGAQNER